MKITPKYIREFAKKYAPELKRLRIKVESNTEEFISFASIKTIVAPVQSFKEIEFFTPEITLKGSILHELGHIATYKGKLKSFDDLVKCEAEAQKWAITRAINKKLNKVACCLIAEFDLWQYMDDGEGKDIHKCTVGQSYAFYNQGNPYSQARVNNNEWVENISKIFFKKELT